MYYHALSTFREGLTNCRVPLELVLSYNRINSSVMGVEDGWMDGWVRISNINTRTRALHLDESTMTNVAAILSPTGPEFAHS